MRKFSPCPPIENIVWKYFDEENIEWTPVAEWDVEDLVDLEVFANAELQRRAQGAISVPGTPTTH